MEQALLRYVHGIVNVGLGTTSNSLAMYVAEDGAKDALAAHVGLYRSRR